MRLLLVEIYSWWMRACGYRPVVCCWCYQSPKQRTIIRWEKGREAARVNRGRAVCRDCWRDFIEGATI